jgi:hypothetical protein
MVNLYLQTFINLPPEDIWQTFKDDFEKDEQAAELTTTDQINKKIQQVLQGDEFGLPGCLTPYLTELRVEECRSVVARANFWVVRGNMEIYLHPSGYQTRLIVMLSASTFFNFVLSMLYRRYLKEEAQTVLVSTLAELKYRLENKIEDEDKIDERLLPLHQVQVLKNG